MLLAFADEQALAQALARELRCELRLVGEHRFPDGEIKLTLPAALPPRVVVLRGLQHPNDRLVELLLLAKTARTLGAQRLTLVSPYLAYMRQDIAFRPGEAISQRIVAGFLGDLFERVLTIDPHLHRIASLDEVMPGSRSVALTAAPLLGRWIAAQWPAATPPLLVGPDEEAAQWVRAAGEATGLEGVVCRKTRHGDRDVDVELPASGIAGRHAFHATVTVTEITGSESFVHLSRDASNWVAVLQGIHEYEPGHLLDAVLDPANIFVFDVADRLVAAPGMAPSSEERMPITPAPAREVRHGPH